MTTKDPEGEWLALVDRIEQAMSIVPFTLRQEDVITLLSMAVNGNQYRLRNEDLEQQIEIMAGQLGSRLSELEDVCIDRDEQVEEVGRLRQELADCRTNLAAVVVVDESEPC